MRTKHKNGGKVRQRVHIQPHEDHKVYVETTTDERETLAKNERIRKEELLKRDSKNPLVDGDVIGFAFQWPSLIDFNIAKAKYPDIFEDVMNGNDFERFRAAERLEILYPQYVTCVRRGDSRIHVE